MSLAEQLEELNQYITVGIKNGAGFSEKEKDELWKDVGNIIMPVQIRCISGKMEEMNDLLNCFYYSFSRLYFSRFMLYRGKCERTDMYLFAATVSMHGEICTEEDCILTEKIIDEIPEEDFAPDLLYLRAKGYEEKGDLKNALACLGTISELYKAEKAAEEINRIIIRNRQQMEMMRRIQNLFSEQIRIVRYDENGNEKIYLKNESDFKKYSGYNCTIGRTRGLPVGLFSYFTTVLGSIKLCRTYGLTPYVEDEGRVAWNSIFGIKGNMEFERCDGKTVFYENIPESRPSYDMNFLTDRNQIQYWHKLYKENIDFTEKAQKYIADHTAHMKFGHMLGVLIRGTDYTSQKPSGHPIQPDPEEMLDITDNMMKTYGYDEIFLASEDKGVLQKFEKKFGKKLHYADCRRVSECKDRWLEDVLAEEEVDIELWNMNYVLSVYILSKCRALAAGRTSGAVGALVMSEGYEHTFFWNEGMYK